MLLSEFDYELPEELIAQRPSDKRENSRMMVLNRDEHKILNKHFYDIVDLLDENHVLILSQSFSCPDCQISIDEIEPRSFSFKAKN